MKDKEIKRLKRENELLRQRAELNKIDAYYISLIRQYAEEEAIRAVENILKTPIEMTHEEIEEAFGHKIKIVNSKE